MRWYTMHAIKQKALNQNIKWLLIFFKSTCISKSLLWFDMLTSTNSWVNLKGEFSNPRFLPGDVDNINPKSICIICPSESNRIFPLCLKIKIYHSKFFFTKKKQFSLVFRYILWMFCIVSSDWYIMFH